MFSIAKSSKLSIVKKEEFQNPTSSKLKAISDALKYQVGTIFNVPVDVCYDPTEKQYLEHSNHVISNMTEQKLEKTRASMKKKVKNSTKALELLDDKLEKCIDTFNDLLMTRLFHLKVIEHSCEQIKYIDGSLFNRLGSNVTEYIFRFVEKPSPNMDFSFLGPDYWVSDPDTRLWQTYFNELTMREKRYEFDNRNEQRVLFNLRSTCKSFRDIMKNIYILIRLGGISHCESGCCTKDKSVLIKIPEGVDKDTYSENLLYVPYHQSGRTIIHALGRTLNLDVLSNFVSRFSGLNINIGTLDGNWSPFHNALWHSAQDTNIMLSVFAVFMGFSPDCDQHLNLKFENAVYYDIIDFCGRCVRGKVNRDNICDSIIKIKETAKNHQPFTKNEIRYDLMNNLSEKEYMILLDIFILIQKEHNKTCTIKVI